MALDSDTRLSSSRLRLRASHRVAVWLSVSVGLVYALWLVSLFFSAGSVIHLAYQNGRLAPDSRIQPDWRDALTLSITINDVAIQQQRGQITWQAGQRIGRMPITVISDGQMHAVVVPIGISPDWANAVDLNRLNLQVIFPNANSLRVEVAQPTLIKRSVFALDLLLGRVLMAWLPLPPDAQALSLITAFLFSLSLVAIWPCAWLSRRSLFIGLMAILCAIKTMTTLATEWHLLPQLWQRYAGQTENELIAAAPHYADSPQINALLAQAAETLPDGFVLVRYKSEPDTYLKTRAHYLLFPRAVIFARIGHATDLKNVASVIQPSGSGAPGPGWQYLFAPIAHYEAWAAPNQPASQASVQTVGLAAWPRWLLAVALVGCAGFGLAGLLGWRRWERLACSLPCGAGLVAAWMTLLSITNIHWSVWNIGALLALAGCGLMLAASRQRTTRLRSREDRRPMFTPAKLDGISMVAVMLIIGLAALVSVPAALVPFTDQDTWTTWGYNSRAFFAEGNLQMALEKYGESGLSHPSYPPTLPLLQAWVFYGMGGISERLIKLMMPLWYLSLIALVWCECRRWTTTFIAAACAVLLATTPLLLDHATLGNADLPFTTMLVAAAIALMRWLEFGQRRWLASGGLLLGIATCTKLDGLYLGILLLTLASAIRLWLTVRAHNNSTIIHTFVLAFGSVGGLLALNMGWLFFIRLLRIKGETPSLALLRVNGLSNFARGWAETFSEMLFSHNNSTWGLMGGGYGLLWVIGFGAVALSWRNLHRDAVLLFLILNVIAIVTFYVLIYTVRPFFSIERYLMHAAPLLILAAARATRVAPVTDA